MSQPRLDLARPRRRRYGGGAQVATGQGGRTEINFQVYTSNDLAKGKQHAGPKKIVWKPGHMKVTELDSHA